MRVSVFPLILAVAGAIQYTTASPVRVVLVSSESGVSTDVSFGDVRPIPVFSHDATLASTTIQVAPQPGAGRRPLCHKMKEQALAWSNKFRQAVGLPLIEPEAAVPILRPVATMPHALRPTPTPSADAIRILPIGPPGPVEFLEPDFVRMGQPGMGERPMKAHHRQMRCSFLHRAHRAIMMLGPWEGRAVAFVLGCGIGVLLRMLWVVTIVVARAIRGTRTSEDEDVQSVLVFEADAENLLLPPPEYTDEKVAIAHPSEAERENKA